MKSKIFLASTLVLGTPFVAAAATTDVASLFEYLTALIAGLVPFVISLAVLFFLWGVFKFVASGDDEEKRASGRQLMINGVIAIFVMVSIWGLIAFLDSTLGLEDDIQEPVQLPVPTFPAS